MLKLYCHPGRIAGFIIGFALQDTLSSFASSMTILLYRLCDVCDAVEAGGVMGTVKDVNLISITIVTLDNRKLVVPNSKIRGDVIRDITAEPKRHVDMTFGVAYADDVDHNERVLWDIVTSNELVLKDPSPSPACTSSANPPWILLFGPGRHGGLLQSLLGYHTPAEAAFRC